MIIKNGTVIETMLPALELLGRKETPVLTALKIRKILRLFREHAGDVEEFRNELLERFGKKDGEGKPVKIPGDGPGTFVVPFIDAEAREKFVASANELYSGEWDYTGPTITVDDLGAMVVGGALLADLGDLLMDGDTSPAEKEDKE